MTRVTPCRFSVVLRYRHPGAKPDVEAIEWTAAPAFKQAYAFKAQYPAERVTVLQDGYETEVTA